MMNMIQKKGKCFYKQTDLYMKVQQLNFNDDNINSITNI